MRLPFLLMVAILPLAAQTPTARFQGTVQDPSGGVIPKAQVSLVNDRTGVRWGAATNEEGYFLLPELQPDVYSFTVTARGFRPTTVTNLELIVGADESQVVKLEVGSVSDSVSVEAQGVRVQTTEASISREVNVRDIDTLPLLLRTPVTLANYMPGVVVAPAAYGNITTQINGTRAGANNVTLDGVDINSPVSPTLIFAFNTNIPNNTDSVEELRVITNGAKAEYGRNGGAQIQLLTRSGSNIYHGNLFEYLRNTDLNANDFFNNSSGVPRQKLIENTFGGSVGGYVQIPKVYNGKNRTFFFFNYQGLRVAQDVVDLQQVPTEAARRGIFQWKTPGSSQVQSYDMVANDPRHIGIDKQVAATFPLIPLPNNFDIGDGLNTAGFRFNQPLPRVQDASTAKFDHNFGASQRLFFRFSRKTGYLGVGGGQTYPGQPLAITNTPGEGFAAGWTSTWKPWLVNEFLAGYSSFANEMQYQRPKGPVVIPSAGITGSYWTTPIQSAFDNFSKPRVNQYADDLSFQRGKHDFKTGVSATLTNQRTLNEGGIFPNIYTGSANGAAPPIAIGPSGSAVISATDRSKFENLYNNLLGRVSSINLTYLSDLQQFLPACTQRVRNYLYHDYGYFFQDDWKVRPNLTLNLGLRWEFFGRPVEANGFQGVLQQAALVNSVSQVSSLTVQKGDTWYANNWNGWRPRFGFAWDVLGNGKLAVRASYGVFSDRTIGQAASQEVDPNTPGFSSQQTSPFNSAAGSDVRVSDNPPVPAQPAAPLVNPPANRLNGTLFLFDPHYRTPYVQQFNFSIQAQVAQGTVVEAAYVGNRGLKLYTDINLDQGQIFGDFLQAFKQLQAFRANGTPVPPSNALVRMFGSPAAAVTALGPNNFDTGQTGNAAQILDTIYFAKYAAAGVSDFYIRNYPQFNAVLMVSNAGRSYYNSMQLSVRRRRGALGLSASYTWSKSIDNESYDGAYGYTPIDSFNMRLNRGRSDFDRPQVFNWMASYTLPIGRNKLIGRGMPDWADRIVGGWDLGTTGILESGPPMTAISGLFTAGLNVLPWDNYSGDRNIGGVQKAGNGVFYFTPAQIAKFNFPGAGEIGTSGRNTFRGPGFFDLDVAMSKKFRVTERSAIGFRAEAYNLLNHANFAPPPNLSPSNLSTFGRITATVPISALAQGSRTMQGALRFDF
jgi:hypothetical protein